MNHAGLLAGVTGICEELGLLWHHCPDSRRCRGSRGMPDLIIAGPYGLILAELKTGDADTTADQDLWLYTLHRGGVPYAVWRPKDWDAGTIQAKLEEMTRPRCTLAVCVRTVDGFCDHPRCQ